MGLPEFFAKIENLDEGKRTLGDTLGDGEELILPAAGVMISFQGWCGGAEQSDRSFELGADDGDVAAVVARRFFLLVAGLLLFVDDNEAKIFDGRKNGGTRADNDARFAVAHAPPFAGACDIAERGVQDR